MRRNKMIKILTIICSLLPLTVLSAELTIDAPANKAKILTVNNPFPVGGLFGNIVIKKHEYNTKIPTRFVIGFFEKSPEEHAFQVVLERIKEKEEYWLIYEYIKDKNIQLRIEVQSGIKLEQEIPFDFFYHKGGRLQITTFETSHYPVTSLKVKTPFFKASSGSATIKYQYKEAYWKQNIPAEAK